MAIICAVAWNITFCMAQSDDFNTWTKFKVNHKIDSRFSVSGDLELRMKDDVSKLDRWGLIVGGSYRPYSFLNLGVGYETHLRNLGDSDWKFRHRYHITATASFRYQWLKVAVRERFQQTFDRGNSETRLRSRLKLSYAPTKGIVSPYFSVEIYQSLDDVSFWRADRMRYRPRSRNSFGQTLVVGCILLLSICIFARQTHCRNRSGIFFLKLVGS